MMTEYILNVIGKELDNDIIKDRICKYEKTNKVKYLVCNTIDGMETITYLIEDGGAEPLEEDTYLIEDGGAEPLEEDYGSGYPCAFCYVLNLAEDLFSEFGDCFFEERQGIYHRIS